MYTNFGMIKCIYFCLTLSIDMFIYVYICMEWKWTCS
jgi:hypothetical protein